MYKDVLLALYKNPKNYGRLDKKTATNRRYNPLCGDDITMDINMDKGSVKDIKFSGESCAICRASASLLTEYAKHKPATELLELNAGFMQDLLGIEISAGRVKCLLLPLEVLQSVL